MLLRFADTKINLLHKRSTESKRCLQMWQSDKFHNRQCLVELQSHLLIRCRAQKIALPVELEKVG